MAQRGDQDLSSSTSYAAVAVQWTRQVRVYAQSIQLYLAVAERRSRQRQQSVGRPDQRRKASARHLVQVESANSSVGGRAWSDDDVIAPALLRTDRRHDLDRDHDRDLRHGPLTARQLEIATLIARGLTNEQIADELVLTRGTVGNHIGHILRRLGAKNRAQVAAWMVRRTVDERAVKSG